MGELAPRGDAGTPPMASELPEAAREITGYWWLWLVVGISWISVSVVILQFDETSVRAVGVIVGLMFLLAGFQNLALAGAPVPLRWVWVLFGVLFVIAGIVSLANPEDTFAGLADVLGFLFLLVGVWWMVRAFLERAFNPLWWLGLIAGILMNVLAFWTAGQSSSRRPSLRRDLGADGGDRRHHARVRRPRAASGAVAAGLIGCVRPAASA